MTTTIKTNTGGPQDGRTLPAMVRMYFEDARFGDGYRLAMVMHADAATATLYLPCELAAVRVAAARLEKAQPVGYRPGVVRANMLKRATLYRRIGRRFARKAAVEALAALGAKRAAILASVEAAALPETVAAREARALRAERAAEWAAVEASIADKIAWQTRQPAERAKGAKPTVKKGRTQRRRAAHPDQFALVF